MTKRTLESLRSKAWYRLVKVLYVGVFALSYIIFLGLILSEGVYQVDKDNTKITCLLGNHNVYSLAELGIYLTPSDFKYGFDYKEFFKGYNNYEIQTILKKCSTNPTTAISDVFLVQALVDLKYDTSVPESSKAQATKNITDSLERTLLDSDKAELIKFNAPIFSIQPVMTARVWLMQSVVGTVVFCVAFELLRRLFYYILLGVFNPKVTNKEV